MATTPKLSASQMGDPVILFRRLGTIDDRRGELQNRLAAIEAEVRSLDRQYDELSKVAKVFLKTTPMVVQSHEDKTHAWTFSVMLDAVVCESCVPASLLQRLTPTAVFEAIKGIAKAGLKAMGFAKPDDSDDGDKGQETVDDQATMWDAVPKADF